MLVSDLALCPICNGDNFKDLYPKYTGRAITSQIQFLENITFSNKCCLNCGFIFNAQGTRNLSQELYTKEQWKPKPQVLVFEKDKAAKGQQEKAYDAFAQMYTFSHTGNILDFGAGSGRFLEYFNKLHSGWQLHAIEPGGGYMEHAQRIPSAKTYNKPYYELSMEQKMNVVVAMSVLEHVENPLHALTWIADVLTEDGVALLQHPDFAYLPGDLLCADHIGKLTVPHMQILCEQAGLRIEKINQGSVLFTFVCRKGKQPFSCDVHSIVATNCTIAEKAEKICKNTVDCVKQALDTALKNKGKVAIFGTSPVGCMARYILQHEQNVTCFVDENPNTWGREQDGLPIISPAQMKKFDVTDLAIAISPVYWEVVAQKMRNFGIRVHTPNTLGIINE